MKLMRAIFKFEYAIKHLKNICVNDSTLHFRNFNYFNQIYLFARHTAGTLLRDFSIMSFFVNAIVISKFYKVITKGINEQTCSDHDVR